MVTGPDYSTVFVCPKRAQLSESWISVSNVFFVLFFLEKNTHACESHCFLISNTHRGERIL